LFGLASLNNKFRTSSLIGEGEVVVSLTSHGARLRTVHATIETIAGGRLKPKRVILWVDNQAELTAAKNIAGISRLMKRGLELRSFAAIGPHSKYFPYVMSLDVHTLPLVTADDDVFYDGRWLQRLMTSFRVAPELIHCYRAHVFTFGPDGKPAPYNDWPACRSEDPSFATFLTGVSGVIYPPAFLSYLRGRGEQFMICAPKADDVWLHACAVGAGFRTSQISPRPRTYLTIVGAQAGALWRYNAEGEGNDKQIAATYDNALLAKIRS
jgi:hypothetical protein